MRIGTGKKVHDDFLYTSENNTEWMSIDFLRKWIKENHDKIGIV